MTVNFGQFQVKFIKVESATVSIDVTMTERNFYANRPNGVYRVPVFPKSHFGGIDYSDMENLASIEVSDFWEGTYRSTFLLFNEQNKELLINISGYRATMDPDLKSSGDVVHSKQVCWSPIELSTTKTADSKFQLYQTDGSIVYGKLRNPDLIQNPQDPTYYNVYPPMVVELEKKSIIGRPIFNKDNTLWVKADDDSSPIMINNFVKNVNTTPLTYMLSADNKFLVATHLDGTVRKLQTCRFGRRTIYFDQNTSTQTDCMLTTFNGSINLKNETLDDKLEYTENQELKFMLFPDEAIIFYIVPSRKYTNSFDTNLYGEYENTISWYQWPRTFDETKFGYGDPLLYEKFSDGNPIIQEMDLVSIDTRKMYTTNIKAKIKGYNKGSIFSASFGYLFDTVKIFEDLPDGYIALLCCRDSNGNNMTVRFKRGEAPTKLVNRYADTIVITGVTMYSGGSLNGDFINKNEVINGTGFIALEDSDNELVFYSNEMAHVTILRVN